MSTASAAKQPEIIAHRGYSAIAPENTMASIKMGWEHADASELDIYITPDKRLMVIHDGNTKRTTGKDYVITATESAVLRELDAGSWKDPKYKGEKIPFLEDVLKEIPSGKRLFIEVKSGTETVPVLEKMIKESGKEKQLVIISFKMEVCELAKKQLPKIPVYFLSGADKPKKAKKSPASTKLGRTKEEKEVVLTEFGRVPHELGLFKQAQKSGLDGLDLDYMGMTAQIVNEAEVKDQGIFVWTVDDPDAIRKLADMGVHGITTNDPEAVKNALKK